MQRLSADDVWVLMGLYRRDPVGFARDILGVNLTGYQEDILRSLVDKDITAVRSCHGIGKSFIAAVAVIWFMCCHYPARVVTTAPTNRQVETVLWVEITRLIRRAKIDLGGHLITRKWTLSDDWFAVGYAPRDWDESAFQGQHEANILIVVDEAAGVSDVVFTGVRALMTGDHARMLMIGNPTNPTGEFGKAFSGSSTFIARFIVDAFSTPNFTAFGITIDDIRSGAWKVKMQGQALPFPSLVTPKWVRMQWEDWCDSSIVGESNPLWQARVMAKFPTISDDILIPLDWIEAAQERWYEADEMDAWEGQPNYGVDVARFGENLSIIAKDHVGQGVRELEKLGHSSIPNTAGWVINHARGEDEGVGSIRVDADGLGAGVYDLVNDAELPTTVVSMNGGLTAYREDRYVNLRSEWYCQLRDKLDPARGATYRLPPNQQLAAQLCSIKFEYDKKGRIAVESKKERRKRGLKSPDEADAVVYAGAELGQIEAIPNWDPDVGRASNYFRS